MATWPIYAKPISDGYSETPAPIADRGEMDRGVPKQRRTQSDVVITVAMTLLFLTTADAEAFEDWYYSNSGAAAGAASFDWTHPRTGTLYQARVVANSLGLVQPFGVLPYVTRTVQIDYVKVLTL
jgi:hypothetical protein